jgi:amidase
LLDALWQIGPLARFVEDLTMVLPIIAGVDWRDPAIVPMPLGDATQVDLKALRVAFHTDNGIETPDRETIETVENAARALEASVAGVEEARPPGIEQTYEIYLGLFTADGGAGLEELLELAGTKKVHPLMQRALDLQRAHAKSVPEFGALLGQWDAFRRSLLSFMEKFDVMVCPVCSFPGMVHGSTYDRLSAFSYTMTYNLAGWPAAVVRAGGSRNGLPIGVQIVARPWREDVALAVAAKVEKALGGYQRPPL